MERIRGIDGRRIGIVRKEKRSLGVKVGHQFYNINLGYLNFLNDLLSGKHRFNLLI